MTVPAMASRFRGCMLGGAIGDALGAPLEFLSADEIRRRYGEEITTFSPAYGRVGAITDDTQMTLFTAEGFIHSFVCSEGDLTPPSFLHQAYLRWLSTQGPKSALARDSLESGWLVKEAWMHSRRAPGNTCLSALIEATELGANAENDSKGCGGVMRAAACGLVAAGVAEAFSLGVECARLTHGHPSGYLAAGHLAGAVNAIRDGAALPDAVAAASEVLRRYDDHPEVLSSVDAAVALAAEGASSASVGRLGQGWVAEEALAISIYCALVAEDFLHGVSLAVAHGGDSDSTGAITGNILGAQWGEEALPTDLRDTVEGGKAITRIADDLYDATHTQRRSKMEIALGYPGFR